MDQLIQVANEFELSPNKMKGRGWPNCEHVMETSHSLTKCRSLCPPPHRMVFPSVHITLFLFLCSCSCCILPTRQHSLPYVLYLTSLHLNPSTAPCRATTLILVSVVTGQHGTWQGVVMLPSEQHDQVLGWAYSSGEKCCLSPPIVSLRCCMPVA
jgi:hypothetical protein